MTGPLVPGHESSGTVVSAGGRARDVTHLQPGGPRSRQAGGAVRAVRALPARDVPTTSAGPWCCVRRAPRRTTARWRGCGARVYPAAIELISSGKVPVKKLITNRFKFEQAEEAFQLVKAGWPDVFKVMIEGVRA
ncbi:hypothetical protein F4809DRAFT_644049 [Biscogniauxia mediterranea]|nr:hypothetical protein F4809DRAFT_644049 [Biscogniauxia mediterranea]